jgi:hypothetical protein
MRVAQRHRLIARFGVDGKVIIKCIIEKYAKVWIGWGPMASSCEHGNEYSGTTKAWNSLTICVYVKFKKKYDQRP